MQSYYGGPAGRNFEIKKIFRTKVDLVADINLRWASNVGIGDLVMISYGMPNDIKEGYFNEYEKQDIEKFGKSYNSTLWQKVYFDSTSQVPPPTAVIGADGQLHQNPFYVVPDQDSDAGQLNQIVGADLKIKTNEVILDNPDEATTNKDLIYGLAYKLIGSLTGNTPNIDIEHIILHAYQEPQIAESNPESLDNPVFTLSLPQGYDIPQGQNGIDPTVATFCGKDENGIVTATNEKYHAVLKASEKPEFKIYTEYTEVDGKPVSNLHFQSKLPEAYHFTALKPIKLNVIDDPTVDLTYTYEETGAPDSNIDIQLGIPRAQEIDENATITNALAPSLQPRVVVHEDATTKNTYYLEFNLPRSARIGVGSPTGYLNKPNDFTISDVLRSQDGTSLTTGDFYIHAGMGYLYYLNSISGAQYHWKYQCKLQPKTPTATINPIETYDNNAEIQQVTIETNSDAVEAGAADTLQYQFNIPRLPGIDALVHWLPSSTPKESEDRTVTIDRTTNASTATYTIPIPRGTRIITNEADKVGVYDGDLYINTIDGDDNRGQIYQYDASSNSWPEVGSLRVINKPLQFIGGDQQIIIEEIIGEEIETTITRELAASEFQNTIKEGQILTVYVHTKEDLVIPYWCYRKVDDVHSDGVIILGDWICVELGESSDSVVSNAGEVSEYKTFSSQYIVNNYYSKNETDNKVNNAIDQLVAQLAWHEIRPSS